MINKNDISLLKSNLTIDNALDVVAEMEENRSLSNEKPFVKWKGRKHQVLFEGNNYFYKIYETSATGVGPFFSLIRNALAGVYSELGIDWKVISFERDSKIYDFEQREVLEVASERDGSFAEIFLSFSNLLEEVEKRLEFESLLEQLKREPEFSNLGAIKILRNCVNKFEDYAIFNGQAILLDDAEFFIALATKDGKEIAEKNTYFKEVELTFGKFLFSNAMGVDALPECGVDGKPLNRWYLIPKSDFDGADKSIVSVENALMTHAESAIKHNIELVDVFECEPKLDEPPVVVTEPIDLDIYEKLNRIGRCPIRVVTSWQSSQEVAWSVHMKNIAAYYPWVKTTTKIPLTQEFCGYYLEGIFEEEDFVGRNKTQVEYVLPTDKLAPERETFRRFLLKFARENELSFKKMVCDINEGNAAMVRDIKQVNEALS